MLGPNQTASPRRRTRQIVLRHPLNPVAIVGEDVEHAFGGVRGYPTSVLIDRTGVVRYEVIGPLAPATLEPAVRRLLGAGG